MFRGFFNDSFFDDFFEDGHDRSRKNRLGHSFEDEDMGSFGSLQPFGMDLSKMFSGMSSGMMDQGNSFGFSSTQVQSYVNDGSGKPKIYSASKLTKHAPGGIRQEQRTLRDTEKGIEKMSLGRHLNERGHVVTKSRDQRSGNIDEYQDYMGFAEEEKPIFDNDWQRATHKFLSHNPSMKRLTSKSDKRNKLREKHLKADRLALEDA